MAQPDDKRCETLLATMEIIDPDGSLVLGSSERRIVTETILQWIDEIGPERTLNQVEQTKAHLQGQVAFLASM